MTNESNDAIANEGQVNQDKYAQIKMCPRIS